ncbi:hypothetical protein GpartN1_g7161.t1 [Galdieria partita]|uniref:Coilin N-terminal domain-containing protein n=1 Tax=Galdieria partita TaxID=83374 RepID=A0A9C7UUB0_9RHOD|nr:hypothetical protein GpartN1_g7161.t1 [Galdieria partita]
MSVHRLKLYFQDFSQIPYWIKVPPEIHTIGDLMDVIQKRYRLKTRPLLLLKGGVLPEFEELDLLINEEELWIQQGENKDEAKGNEQENSANDDLCSVGDDTSLLAQLEHQRNKLQTTTPQNRKQRPSASKKRRWRKKKLKVRSAEPVESHSSDSSFTDSSASEEQKVFLPRGNVSSTLRRLEKEHLWASQDRQWNQSYQLQGSKPITVEEDNNMQSLERNDTTKIYV